MVAAVVAFFAGVVVATAVTWRWSRLRVVQPALESEPVPTADLAALRGDTATALDALPIGVVITTADGTELIRNRAAHTVGARHHQVLLDEALESLTEQVHATGVGGERVVELQGQQPRVMSLGAHPLSGGGVIATVADITERVRLDHVRTDFVANLSHELKTPVGALAVLAETISDLMEGDRLDDDDRTTATRLATKMVAEAHRMSHSIDELLELSRIELEGAVVRSDSPVSTLVCEAVERARPLADPVGIVMDVRFPHNPIMVRGDARQLISALGNLLENAVKYSEPGSRVEIGVRELIGEVEFWVRDWGVGIPARDLDRVFERFYRVDRARSRDTGGTGLGLAIVRHVATNHAGTISVTSIEGEGSTFVLRIPSHVSTPAEEDR